MMKWPEDHPGRKCGGCGQRVYPLWIGDTPPPGTCPENASCAAHCLRVRDHLRLGLFLNDGKLSPTRQVIAQRVGLTIEDIKADEAFHLRVEVARRALDYSGIGETPALAFEEPLRAWIDEDPEVRALVVIKWILSRVDWCDGQRTVSDIGNACELFGARARALIEEMQFRDYETAAE